MAMPSALAVCKLITNRKNSRRFMRPLFKPPHTPSVAARIERQRNPGRAYSGRLRYIRATNFKREIPATLGALTVFGRGPVLRNMLVHY
jgi:hypothetical protein